MSLESLLKEFSKILNYDQAYNMTMLAKEDRCAAKSKYLYGYGMNYLIREIIKKTDNTAAAKEFVAANLELFKFNFNIVKSLYEKYLSTHPRDATSYKEFSNYILKYCSYLEITSKAEQIKQLVDEKQFDAALAVLKTIIN